MACHVGKWQNKAKSVLNIKKTELRALSLDCTTDAVKFVFSCGNCVVQSLETSPQSVSR